MKRQVDAGEQQDGPGPHHEPGADHRPGPGGRQRWAFRVGLALTALLLLEGGLRLVLGNIRIAPYQVRPPDGRCVGLRPGAAVTYTGWMKRIPPVRHAVNSMGYRGPERPEKAPPETLRVLVLGDSMVFGQGVPAEGALPARLEAALAARPGARAVQVLNFGVPGYNVEESADSYLRFASRWDHDHLVLLLTDNDLDRPLCAFLGRPALAWAVLNIYLFRVIYGYLGQGILPPDPEVKRTGQDRLGDALDRLAAAARRRGTALSVVSFDGNWPLRVAGADLEAMCRNRRIPYADLGRCPRLAPRGTGALPRIPGEGHLTAEGNDLAARCVADLLGDALGRR